VSSTKSPGQIGGRLKTEKNDSPTLRKWLQGNVVTMMDQTYVSTSYSLRTRPKRKLMNLVPVGKKKEPRAKPRHF